MQYTNRTVVNLSGRRAGVYQLLGQLALVTGVLLGTGCASLSDSPNQTLESDISRSSSSDSTLTFARLPSTRPEVNVKPRSAQLFSESLVALANSDYVVAEQLLVEITKIQPELSGPWLNLGQVYLAGERNGSARQAFERAIEANPTNCAAFNQLGVLARKEGRLDEAESSYLACIDRDPTFAQVYLNLGILYEVYLGKLPQAFDAYREYQDLQARSGVEDPRVKGWLVDLERRL